MIWLLDYINVSFFSYCRSR